MLAGFCIFFVVSCLCAVVHVCDRSCLEFVGLVVVCCLLFCVFGL